MTMRSLSKNVEILPESSGDELIIRLSEAFSERMRLWAEDNSKAAASHLRSFLNEVGFVKRCPFCGRLIPFWSRYCIFCGKALDPFAQEYERKQQKMTEEMKEEMKEDTK